MRSLAPFLAVLMLMIAPVISFRVVTSRDHAPDRTVTRSMKIATALHHTNSNGFKAKGPSEGMKSVFSVSGALRPGIACEITGPQLDLELESQETPILLDVYANWCGPCRMVIPEVKIAAARLGSNCRVAKLDSDKFSPWAGRFEVRGLPTVLLIHKGEVVDRLEGAYPSDALLALANLAL